jgi:predicted helicase
VLLEEYEQNWKITEAMPVNSVGIVTARDALTIHFTLEDAWRTVQDFAKLPIETAREKYDLGKDARDWKVDFAQKDLKNSGLKQKNLVPILYRPFDMRHTYYTGTTKGFHCMPRNEVMREMIFSNLCILLPKQTKDSWSAIVSNCIAGHKSASVYDISSAFPLYVYPIEKQDLLENPAAEKRANFAPEFLHDVKNKLGKVSPEALFAYLYAVLYSPAYRARYAEFLKRDFPRVPITTDRKRFDALAALGQQLINLHVMHVHAKPVCTYPVAGNNRVDKVEYRQDAESSTAPDNGRLHINKEQYFADVPEAVWNYHIGGYQVAHKWLKDRKGRLLTFDDLQHYQHVLAALAETIRLQTEIDKVIPAWPMT